MKKIFLIVAILMLATPAFAVTVDITLRAGDDVNQVEVWYDVTDPELTCPDGNRPRAFGLNITTQCDANIIDINVPFEGECDDVNKGYGIFPGTISIVDDEVTGWGSPIAPDDDPGAEGTGLDTNTIIVEMGSLYTGANCPDPCAMLFYITVELDCNVCVTGDAARTGGSPAQGVILESLGAVTVNWDCIQVTGVSRFVPDVTGMTQAAATTAIEAVQLVVGDVTEECHPTIAVGNIIRTDPIALTEVPQDTEIDLVKSLGECDFGDAPDPTYPTLLASDGARHIIGGGNLGALVDADADGQPNATATGDDNDGTDDEDGVVFTVPGVIVVGTPGPHVTVTASVAGNLNAWLDLNADGDWADAGEQIFTNQALIAGPNPLAIPIACGATSETTVSRWRFTTGISVPDTNEYGLEIDGEVEDHEVEIVCHVPDVCDMNVTDATAALEDACFNLGTIYYECSDTVDACDVTRADPPYCTYPECGSDVDIYVSTGSCCTYPACWDWDGQCQGDTVGDDKVIGIGDFLAFKAAFGHDKPDPLYDPCADYNRDGLIGIGDFLTFKAAFSAGTVPGGCPTGDINGVYCP